MFPDDTGLFFNHLSNSLHLLSLRAVRNALEPRISLGSLHVARKSYGTEVRTTRQLRKGTPLPTNSPRLKPRKGRRVGRSFTCVACGRCTSVLIAFSGDEQTKAETIADAAARLVSTPLVGSRNQACSKTQPVVGKVDTTQYIKTCSCNSAE